MEFDGYWVVTIAVGVIAIVLGGITGFLLSDGVPQVIDLTENQERQIRNNEALGCTRLLNDQMAEMDRVKDNLKACLNREIFE